MKKIALTFLTTAFLTTSSFAEPVTESGFDISPSGTATISVAQQNLPESVSISNDMEIVATTKREANAEMAYTIDAVYPQINGTLTPAAKEFNRLVLDMVTKNMERFKNYVKADMPHMQTLPDPVKHNSLHIDYGVDVVKPTNQTLVSVRLSIEGMQAGRAHPYHLHQVLNFDLTQGKTLSLKNLFKNRANYLNVIAKYSSKSLNEKLEDKWMINEGTAPLAKNYQTWNLEDDGILITFSEYQVAPYSYGVQEVQIPYAELKGLLATNSPIAACAKSEMGCGGEG